MVDDVSDYTNEKRVTGIIGALINLKAEIDKLAYGSGILEITVNRKAKDGIDFVTRDMRSFYFNHESQTFSLDTLCGIKISVRKTI